MTVQRLVIVTLLLVLPLACVAADPLSYSGFLQTPDFPNGIHYTSGWVTNPYFYIGWTVTLTNPAGPWYYDYEIRSPVNGPTAPEISHWLLEVTNENEEGFNGAFDKDNSLDIVPGSFSSNLVWDPDETESTWHSKDPANPGMPQDLYAVKWGDPDTENGWPTGTATVGGQEVTYKLTTIAFESYRNPVWGNFYVKAANEGFWNAGFEDNTVRFEPPSDGSLNHKILAPNGYIPEPASTVLLGLGFATLVGTRLRRRRKD